MYGTKQNAILSLNCRTLQWRMSIKLCNIVLEGCLDKKWISFCCFRSAKMPKLVKRGTKLWPCKCSPNRDSGPTCTTCKDRDSSNHKQNIASKKDLHTIITSHQKCLYLGTHVFLTQICIAEINAIKKSNVSRFVIWLCFL